MNCYLYREIIEKVKNFDCLFSDCFFVANKYLACFCLVWHILKHRADDGCFVGEMYIL